MNALTVVKLKEKAKGLRMKGYSRLNKADLIKAIEATLASKKKSETVKQKKRQCSHVFVRGAKKGTKCNATSTNGLMCSTHKKCKHGRRRSRCKECGGIEICEHGRQRSQCKECGGSQVCEHGSRRSRCKECGGSEICEHSRRRSRCKECGGSSICEHGRQRLTCKECGGSSICEHSKIRSRCKECGGSSICEHGSRRCLCKECGGSEICEHGRRRSQCKECGGSQICEHADYRARCKECGGSQICEHGGRRSRCPICDPPLHPHNWCQLCKYVLLTAGQYKPYCFMCYCVTFPDEPIKKRYKMKEHHMRDALVSRFPDTAVELVFDKRVDGGCSFKRPDVRLELYTHTLIVECDEFQHKSYSCENKRIMELFQDLGSRPIVFIRFNPDSYMKDGKTIPGCFKKTGTADNSVQTTEWNKRLDVLEKEIKKHLKKVPAKEVTEIKLFFNS